MGNSSYGKYSFYKPIKKPTEGSTYDPSKQVEGYKRRLEGSGIDAEKATDSRNGVERLLNLTPNQNVLFDIFEVLERPQKAMFGAWKAAQEGKSTAEGFKDGLTGNDAVKFKEILHNMGMVNSQDEFGLDDVAGFLGEVFVDPIDLALIPVTGGASLADDIAQAGGKVAKQASIKGAKFANTQHIRKIMDVNRLDELALFGKTPTKTKQSFQELAEDIGRNGFKEPLKVEYNPKTGRAILKEGNHRLAAAKALGIKDVPIIVTKGTGSNSAKGLKIGKDLDIDNVDDLLSAIEKAEGTTKVKSMTAKAGTKNIDESIDALKAERAELEGLMNTTDEGLGDFGWGDDFGDGVAGLGEDFTQEIDEIQANIEKLEKAKIDIANTNVDGERQAILDGIKSIMGERKTEFVSPLQLAGRGTKRGIVGGAKLADKGIDKTLKAIDTRRTADAIKYKKQITPLADEYAKLKDNFVGIFDVAKKLPKGTLESIREATGAKFLSEHSIKALADGVYKKIDNSVEELTPLMNKLGKEADSTTVGKFLNGYHEWKYLKPQQTIGEILETGHHIPMNKETVANLKEIFKKGGLDITDHIKSWEMDDMADGAEYFVFNDKFNVNTLLDNTTDGSLAKRLDTEKWDATRVYKKSQLDLYKKLDADAKFKKVYDDILPDFKQMQKVVDKIQGSKFAKTSEEGYLRHAHKTLDNAYAAKMVDNAAHLGGKNRSNAGRIYKMSAEEANNIYQKGILSKITDDEKLLETLQELDSKEIFNTTLQASIDDWVTNVPDLVKNAKVIDEVLVKSFFPKGKGLESDIVKLNKSKGAKVPDGFAELPMGELVNKLEKMSEVIDSPQMVEVLNKLKKKKQGVAHIDKHVLGMIGVLGEEKKLNALVKIADKMNNLFKQTKLLSPGFQARNVFGNLTNMYLAGMPMSKVPQYMTRANTVLNKGEEILVKVAKEGKGSLSKWEKGILKDYEMFAKAGFTDVNADLYDIPEQVLKRMNDKEKGIMTKIMQWNGDKNQELDYRFRLTFLLYAKQHPSLVKKMGADSAENLVRKALFDPRAVSGTEKDVVKRLVPFYTFAKKNLAFQAENLLDNPKRYKRLVRAFDEMWDIQGIDPNDVKEYQRENFWIPIASRTKKGNYTAIKANLPVGDLGEWMENPLQKAVSSLAPYARAPFEMAMNKKVFSQMPISDFKGQKGYNLPWMNRKMEYGLGEMGLDVPMTGAQDILTGVKRFVTGEEGGIQALKTGLGRTVARDDSVASAKLQRDYQELNEIRDLMKYYKQEGVDILTLAEIENNKKTKGLSSKLDALLNK